MKEDRSSVDSVGLEETENHSPKNTSSSENSSGEKCSLKRGCLSDEEDERLAKIPRISSTSPGRSSLSAEPVITTCSSSLNRFSEPLPGCSKDYVSHITCSSSVKPSKETGNCYETTSVDGQSSNEDVEEEINLPVELMNLSDDVMLIIMSHLKPTDLLNLSSCCQRLCQVASDWSLWIDVDFRPHRLLARQLERFLPFFSESTEKIATRGFVANKPAPRWRTECLSVELLSSFAAECPKLRSFTAEEHCIDANKVKISAFPSTIEYLSLKGSEIINLPTDHSYFNGSCRLLPHLKVLVLSDCTWFPAHSIMALSKQPHLEELHLDGCYLIKDCIAYASLAFNLGFPNLKILNLQRTGVSDSELSCLNRSNRLTHLYLEYPRNFGNANANDNPGIPRPCHLPGIISDQGLRTLIVVDKPHVMFNNAQFGIVSEEIHVMAPVRDRVSLCKLHTLVARNFNLITDATLNELHFAQSLRHLDLKGTLITRHGAEVFRSSRPDVTLVTSYDDEFT